MDARTRALELVAQWHEELRRLVPEGADIFDAHLHLGNDIDGMVGDYDVLEAVMARLRHLPGLCVLSGRARPRAGVPRCERPHARLRRAE